MGSSWTLRPVAVCSSLALLAFVAAFGARGGDGSAVSLGGAGNGNAGAATFGLVGVGGGDPVRLGGAPVMPRPPATGRVVGCAWRGRTPVNHGWRGRRAVALTFDDGPWSRTAAFVALLERERVHATFFVVGREIAGRAWLLRRELADGDAIGNHTWDHADLRHRRAGLSDELSRATAAIEGATGYRPCIFRPPYGAYDRRVVSAATAGGMATVLWDDDPTDWARPGSRVIARRMRKQARPGTIALMHDGGGERLQTLVALRSVIRGLRHRGYRFETVPELLGYRPLYARGGG